MDTDLTELPPIVLPMMQPIYLPTSNKFQPVLKPLCGCKNEDPNCNCECKCKCVSFHYINTI